MLRKAVTIFALLGLLLSGGLWARSHFWIDTLLIPTSKPDHFEACSILGVIHVGLTYVSSRPPVEEARYITSDAQEYDRSMQEGVRKMRTVFRNASTETGKFWRDWKPQQAIPMG